MGQREAWLTWHCCCPPLSGLLGKKRRGHISWPLTATSERAYGALAFARVRVTSTHLQPYGAEWSRPARSSAKRQVREDKGVEVLPWHLRAEEKSVTDVAPAFQQWRGRGDASEDVRMYIDGKSDVVGNATNRQGQVHVVAKAAKYAGAVGQAAATEAQRAAAKNELGGACAATAVAEATRTACARWEAASRRPNAVGRSSGLGRAAGRKVCGGMKKDGDAMKSSAAVWPWSSW